MAKYQWFNGNRGAYAFDRFDDYLEISRTETGLVFGFDASVSDFNPERSAARIELIYRDYSTYVVQEGPDAGTVRVIGGTITGVRYLSPDGAELMAITRLDVPLPVFLATLDRGDAFSAWRMLTSAAGSFTGSGNAAALGHPGTGDVIETGLGADRVQALAGDDYMLDRGGADHYSGGFGFDTVTYDGWYFTPFGARRGIEADLVLGRIIGPDGAVDTISGMEGVSGTFLADVLKGNGVANSFVGFGGADKIDGRGGFDIVSYARDAGQGGTDGIQVNLTTGRVRDPFGMIDKVISIEGIEGTDQRDRFIDNGVDNYLSGRGGDDEFHLGSGADTVRGGGGADSFVFHIPAFGDDTIEDFSAVQGDRIEIEGVTTFLQLRIITVVVAGQIASFIETTQGTITLIGVAAEDLSPADFGL